MEYLRNAPYPNVTLSQEGFQGAILLAMTDKLANYFAQEGCQVDRGYLLNHINDNTPVLQVQRFVRFR
jgi:hypothetical protein